ncbi:MAG: FecR domain-containing protein [Alteromonadaceae bacterium]|tara:strand:- start:156 stop:1229 length:1074 start_codon:yes stop_codon:yes gene_type:complete
MNNVHQLHSKEQVIKEELRLDQASDWIAKLDRELLSAEKTELKIWLAQDNDNIKLLMEIAKMWDKMDDLNRLSDLFPYEEVNKKSTPWFVAMAASFVVAILFTLVSTISSFSPFTEKATSSVVVMQASYQTNVGESHTINLPDNSKLVLNTNSFVQVKYTESARLIELQRGEIHIDVAHDKSRPLSVLTNGKIIQAVGTAFNVKVNNDLVELIVTDGKVLVAKKDNVSLNSDIEQIAKRLPQSSMAISEGEKVELNLTNQLLEEVVKLKPIEIAASLSWRRGHLIFRGDSLVDVMAEISRYTDIKFELTDDEQLKSIQVAGVFKTGDVTGLLKVLNQNFDISYEKVSNDKIILKYSG